MNTFNQNASNSVANAARLYYCSVAEAIQRLQNSDEQPGLLSRLIRSLKSSHPYLRAGSAQEISRLGRVMSNKSAGLAVSLISWSTPPARASSI